MRNNSIRFPWIGRLLGTAVFLTILMAACKEDDPIPVATVQFSSATQLGGEQAGEQTITLNFDKAAATDGTLEVSWESSDAEYGTDFTTNPDADGGSMTLSIAKGQSAAQFRISPVNNNLLDGDRSVTFTLADPTEGFEIGATGEMTFNITDDESPVQANFSVATSSVSEDASAGTTLTVNFSDAVPGTGELTVTLSSANATYGTHYTTEPAAVNNAIKIAVSAGATSASIKVIPVDNADAAEAKTLSLTLSAFSGDAATIGSLIPAHTLTISDNELASQAAFASATGSVSEKESAGLEATISLTPATTGAGTVKVSLTSENAVYGTDYTTDPAAVEGVVTVPVVADKSSVSFKIIPVNDSEQKANRLINLAITGGTGIVSVAAQGTSQAVTITEDDIPVTIASVRALFQGSTLTISDDSFIQGVIISANNNVTARNAFIQDASGGIQLRFAANNTLVRGDEARIFLKDVALGLNSGLLQLGGSNGMANEKAVKIGTGTLPAYAKVTLAELNTGAYESRLVEIENVGFFDANDVNTLRYDGGSGAGNNRVGDASGASTVLRVESYAPFNTSTIPAGTGTLRGIATIFTTTVQLTPQEAADIFTQNETATQTVSQSALSFGDVANGSSSTLTYQVSGTQLIGAVTVKATTGYTVSTDGTTFAAEVSIPSATANAGPVTVTVKFAPTSGVNQPLSGKITHKSVGAKTKEIDLTGNETGNGNVSTLILTENFDYNTGQLTAVNAGTNVSGGKWTSYSGTTNVLQVTSGSLNYTGYPAAVGNKVTMVAGSAEDAYTAFTGVTTGKVYVAFLANVTAATSLAANSSTTGDYFAALLPVANTTALSARVTIKAGATANTYNLGLRASSTNSAAVFSNVDLPLNETRLIVISYEIVAGTTNDVMSMWINPDISGSAPTPTVTQTNAGGDLADITRFVLRQGSNAAFTEIDGIRVALKWEDLFN